MKKIIVSAFAVAALAVPAVASAGDGGAYGKAWQDVTGCTYGDIVRLVKDSPGHPSINGLGAKNGLAAALAAVEAGHPVPNCS